MNANSQKRLLSCPFDYIVHSACFVYLDACLLGSLESNSFKPNYWPPQWPLLITVQCPKETDINSSEKTVPLASTSRPDLASLTTPSDEINQIPEFGIIEFTTETETPNSTEILIQQSSSISTVSKMLSITTNQNQEIETLQTMENIATTNTPVESPELLLVTPSSTVLETSTDVIDFDQNFSDNSAPDLETTIQNQEIKTTTPSDEIDLIPEFGIIEFTTETETPNSTEILIQQSSTISTVSKMISITTIQNQEIETLQTTENIVTTDTPVESPELLLVIPSSTVLETSTSTDVIDFDKIFNDSSAPDPETTIQNQEIETLETMENIVTTNTPVASPELLLVTPSSKVLETSTSTDVIDFDKNFNNNSAPDPETTIQNQEIKTLQTTENIVTTNTPVETPELLLVTPNLTVLETLPSIDVIDFDENFNDNLAPDPEAFSVFLDVLFDQFNESGSSSTPKFTDILFATLNETLEKVPKEDNFASLLFANLPSKEV